MTLQFGPYIGAPGPGSQKLGPSAQSLGVSTKLHKPVYIGVWSVYHGLEMTKHQNSLNAPVESAQVAGEFDFVPEHPVAKMAADRLSKKKKAQVSESGTGNGKALAMRYLEQKDQTRAKRVFAKYHFSPLETLVAAATDPEAPPDLVKSIALVLLPYEVPKLKALDITIDAAAGAPRVAIKNYVTINGQELQHGPLIDVTSDEQRFGPHQPGKPILEAVAKAKEEAVKQGLVEAVMDDEEDEDE